jgi:hypothetical protein
MCHDSELVREPGKFNEVEYHEEADIDRIHRLVKP